MAYTQGKNKKKNCGEERLHKTSAPYQQNDSRRPKKKPEHMMYRLRKHRLLFMNKMPRGL